MDKEKSMDDNLEEHLIHLEAQRRILQEERTFLSASELAEHLPESLFHAENPYLSLTTTDLFDE